MSEELLARIKSPEDIRSWICPVWNCWPARFGTALCPPWKKTVVI